MMHQQQCELLELILELSVDIICVNTTLLTR